MGYSQSGRHFYSGAKKLLKDFRFPTRHAFRMSTCLFVRLLRLLPGVLLIPSLSLNHASAQDASSAPPSSPQEALQRGRRSTLGMRFVSVPGTTVRFSVWETRVSDWNQFLEAKKYPWTFQPHFKQEANHPVVGVNLQDAIAFCNWLTEKERSEELINPAMSYRLPTPEEWDAAAGLASARKNNLSRTAEDQLQDTQSFVWGMEWPPPAKAANYAEGEIPGYNDGFVYTAPVGQFNPTPEGLYDIAGNVWEWTDKPDMKSLSTGTLRGGSWAYFRRECLVSSYRYSVPAELRMATIGFRVVFDDKQLTAQLLAQQDQANKESLEARINDMRRTEEPDKDAVDALRRKMSGVEKESAPDPSKLTAATTGMPYLNTLGLRLVPLEPASHRLICTTETRVRDLDAWLKATSGTWAKKPPFLLGDKHPAAGVSWKDATAFCAWLTDKERKSLLISEKASYRLPTDVEWSLAAGLKGETGADPAARHLGDKKHFPWPTKSADDWVPQIMSVNLDASTGRIPGFSDNFSYTCDVDKSLPNPLGLFEVGGNVSEWCQDEWPGEPTHRVIRGGSWLIFQRDRLLTSARDHATMDASRADLGFRVVLDLGAP